MVDLISQKCVPCEGGVAPLGVEEVKGYLAQINEVPPHSGSGSQGDLGSWEVLEGKKIIKEFKFKNFREAMFFVNKVADIANQEDHHPDISVHYSKVEILLWTHAIGGLSQNDFIVAAKIDNL